MKTLSISERSIPSLEGKVAIISGGSSGIGFAATEILVRKGARVHVLDVNETPDPLDGAQRFRENVSFHRCNVASWKDLHSSFDEVGRIDFAFANAGIMGSTDYFADTWDADGKLEEPTSKVLDVNLRGVLNFVKLAWSPMKRQALVGLIRALRSAVAKDNITINGVASGLTLTNGVPQRVIADFQAQGLYASDAHFVGLALVHSATASQTERVGVRYEERESQEWTTERWNGRMILTVNETYTELEEQFFDLQGSLLRWENPEILRYTRVFAQLGGL
ncbi:hypothetical protein FE257_004281 [Aspergillus nanangensis]|uniref:Uncharacterized protein n=1 Tax=Aspergillus nanangensis TaxID=2582783 RepID=A0AAD4CRK8_ASPNN|nr:hypothetical protein FE257_004281 [Aspergillus nanangensis]